METSKNPTVEVPATKGYRHNKRTWTEERTILETTTTRNSPGNTEMCIKPANKKPQKPLREGHERGNRDEGQKKEKRYIHRIDLIHNIMEVQIMGTSRNPAVEVKHARPQTDGRQGKTPEAQKGSEHGKDTRDEEQRRD